MQVFAVAICSLLFAGSISAQDSVATPKLKIFILAGQSNMEGKGSVAVMNHQLTVPEKRHRFARLQTDGQWLERDDVWIDYLGGQGQRHGKLTTGYGQSKAGASELIGPELGFGWVVGDHFDEDILIIKTAWGGKSIDRDFRPPSRGYAASITQQFENEKKRDENCPPASFVAARRGPQFSATRSSILGPYCPVPHPVPIHPVGKP